jgi:ketosteroid isomerase-like protein
MKSKLLLPLLVLLAGCNVSNQPLTEAQKDAVMKEAVPVVKSFFDALTVNDTTKLMLLINDVPDVIYINPGGAFTGKEMKKSSSQFVAVVEKQSFETKFEKYTVIDPGCFIYSWCGKNGIFFKGGASIINDNASGSYTFKKTDDKWKLIYIHESVNPPVVSDPVKEFTKIEEDWGNALYKKDAAALGLLYADEYMYISLSGKLYNKQQDISEIVSPAYKVMEPYKLSEINVNMYGMVAVVTGVTLSKSSLNGVDLSGSHNFMDIFTYRDGRWQCILSQNISKPQK